MMIFLTIPRVNKFYLVILSLELRGVNTSRYYFGAYIEDYENLL